MNDALYNVLFLCTGNSARSIMAEGILRKEGAGRFAAFSAGSHPKGAVNPLAIKVLESFGYPIDGYRSKPWDEFAAPGAPRFDFVFTVCDSAAGEACPVWPGQPMTAHWGIEDPAAVEGTPVQREAAFVTAFKYLRNRITVFTALPMRSISMMALQAKLREIGRMEGSSSGSARGGVGSASRAAVMCAGGGTVGFSSGSNASPAPGSLAARARACGRSFLHRA